MSEGYRLEAEKCSVAIGLHMLCKHASTLDKHVQALEGEIEDLRRSKNYYEQAKLTLLSDKGKRMTKGQQQLTEMANLHSEQIQKTRELLQKKFRKSKPN